jgi:hypothetical protein
VMSSVDNHANHFAFPRAEAARAGIVCRAVPRPAGCRVPRARCAAVGSRESRCAHMWLLYALCIRTLM